MQISIRKAVLEDMDAIHTLVKELAIYEKLPNEVKTTPESYKEDFENKFFESIVAVDNEGEIQGTCIFYYIFSTWKGKSIYLEDFVVSQTLRGHGIGAKLFEALIEICKERKVAQLKWQIIDWNEPALNFYKKYDFIEEKEWLNGKILF